MYSYRWIIIVALVWIGVIVMDELSYRTWRVVNPGSQYSGLNGVVSSLVDPKNPPATYQ